MANTLIRDVFLIGGMATLAALAMANRSVIYEKLGLSPQSAPAEAVQPNANEPDVQFQATNRLQGTAVSIPKSKADGQYWTEARVNNGYVKFLVDTGASTVALTPEDARRAGIRLDQLTYDIPISTAGGENIAAAVTLKSVSIGAVSIRNVRAIVVPEGLSTSLLGMTYLGELQRVEATPNALILRL